MSKDISKALKKKTDAQLRLLEQDAAPIVRESNTGENFIADPNEYSQQLLAGENITITTAGNTKTINAVMGLLAGDNITISAPDEDGKVTITGIVSDGSINGKDVSIADYTGKDGYVLSYDETSDQFVLSEASSGGSEYTLPQATESALGGIKAKEKTTESAEVAIDTDTGKLYANSFMPYTDDANMIEDFESTIIKIPYVSAQWSRVAEGYNSTYCFKSPRLLTSNYTQFDIVFTLECLSDGILSFWYKTKKESNSNSSYVFKLDGVTIISGTPAVPWTKYEQPITAGTHLLYIRASNNAYWYSEVYIDDISIPLGRTYHQAIDEHSKIDLISENPNKILASKPDGSALEYIPKSLFMSNSGGTALPTASEDLRGQIFTLQGGAGVADISYICQKDASDAYVWQQI